MEIRTDTWHYKFWSITFINGCSFFDFTEPAETTWRQYCRRIVFMAILTMISFVFAWWILFLETILVNMVTILSGAGVWVTLGASAGSYLRKFQSWEVGITFRTGFVDIDKTIYISTRAIAAFIWAVLVIISFWYLWAHTATFQQLGEMTIRDVGATAAPFLEGLLWFGEAILYPVVVMLLVLLITWLFDKLERKNQKYVRRVLDEARKNNTPVPSEIVTFVDPPHDYEVGC